MFRVLLIIFLCHLWSPVLASTDSARKVELLEATLEAFRELERAFESSKECGSVEECRNQLIDSSKKIKVTFPAPYLLLCREVRNPAYWRADETSLGERYYILSVEQSRRGPDMMFIDRTQLKMENGALIGRRTHLDGYDQSEIVNHLKIDSGGRALVRKTSDGEVSLYSICAQLRKTQLLDTPAQ